MSKLSQWWGLAEARAQRDQDFTFGLRYIHVKTTTSLVWN